MVVDADEPRLNTRPWLLAVIVSTAIAFLVAIPVAAMQSFTTSDTSCSGTIFRLLHGGPATSIDDVCRHGEAVRLVWSVVLLIGAAVLIALTLVATMRATRRPADKR